MNVPSEIHRERGNSLRWKAATDGPTGTSASIDITLFGFTVCTVTLNNDVTLTESPSRTWSGTAVIDNGGGQDGTDSGVGCPIPKSYDIDLSLTQ